MSMLTPHSEESIGYHRSGFWHNSSTTDHIFCICQILEKKYDYSEAINQLFIDFKKAYVAVRRGVLYHTLYHICIISLHIIYFPSVDPYRITKSVWIWTL